MPTKYRYAVLKLCDSKTLVFCSSRRKLHRQIVQCNKRIKSWTVRLWLECGCNSARLEVYCTQLLINTLPLEVATEVCWHVYLIPSQVLSKWPTLASTLLIAGLFCFSNPNVLLAEEVMDFFSWILNIKSISSTGEAQIC